MIVSQRSSGCLEEYTCKIGNIDVFFLAICLPIEFQHTDGLHTFPEEPGWELVIKSNTDKKNLLLSFAATTLLSSEKLSLQLRPDSPLIVLKNAAVYYRRKHKELLECERGHSKAFEAMCKLGILIDQVRISSMILTEQGVEVFDEYICNYSTFVDSVKSSIYMAKLQEVKGIEENYYRFKADKIEPYRPPHLNSDSSSLLEMCALLSKARQLNYKQIKPLMEKSGLEEKYLKMCLHELESIYYQSRDKESYEAILLNHLQDDPSSARCTRKLAELYLSQKRLDQSQDLINSLPQKLLMRMELGLRLDFLKGKNRGDICNKCRKIIAHVIQKNEKMHSIPFRSILCEVDVAEGRYQEAQEELDNMRNLIKQELQNNHSETYKKSLTLKLKEVVNNMVNVYSLMGEYYNATLKLKDLKSMGGLSETLKDLIAFVEQKMGVREMPAEECKPKLVDDLVYQLYKQLLDYDDQESSTFVLKVIEEQVQKQLESVGQISYSKRNTCLRQKELDLINLYISYKLTGKAPEEQLLKQQEGMSGGLKHTLLLMSIWFQKNPEKKLNGLKRLLNLVPELKDNLIESISLLQEKIINGTQLQTLETSNLGSIEDRNLSKHMEIIMLTKDRQQITSASDSGLHLLIQTFKQHNTEVYNSSVYNSSVYNSSSLKPITNIVPSEEIEKMNLEQLMDILKEQSEEKGELHPQVLYLVRVVASKLSSKGNHLMALVYYIHYLTHIAVVPFFYPSVRECFEKVCATDVTLEWEGEYFTWEENIFLLLQNMNHISKEESAILYISLTNDTSYLPDLTPKSLLNSKDQEPSSPD